MAEPTITCPSCASEIRLTESLAAPLLAQTRRQFEQRLAQLAAEEAQKAKVAAVAASKAEFEAQAKQLAELQLVLKGREEKLAEAQKAQAEVIKKQRELDDATRELELTVQKRVQEGLTEVRTHAKREAEEALMLKVREKDLAIASMQQKIEELKQKAEQGSQQLQGEAQEVELENLLRMKFSFDAIDPVPKGEFGGDVLQRVANAAGQSCGAILWETKRTKNWSDGWLTKLREDQRAAKADVAILVTQVLPKGVSSFDVVEGIWVTSPREALGLAMVLRQSLLQVSAARQVAVGQQTKAVMVYDYLTGSRFRQRVEAIVEAFSSMQEDLDKERKAIMKQWAKREEQIQRVMSATVGMYGDLQGIAGKSLQEIACLELPGEAERIEALLD